MFPRMTSLYYSVKTINFHQNTKLLLNFRDAIDSDFDQVFFGYFNFLWYFSVDFCSKIGY